MKITKEIKNKKPGDSPLPPPTKNKINNTNNTNKIK
jgi:hypothetical protein